MAAETGVDGHYEHHLLFYFQVNLEAYDWGWVRRGFEELKESEKGGLGRVHTSGRSFSSSASKISHRTSTLVSGLIAMPACMSSSWMYRINAFGVHFSVVSLSSGVLAATEVVAAS